MSVRFPGYSTTSYLADGAQRTRRCLGTGPKSWRIGSIGLQTSTSWSRNDLAAAGGEQYAPWEGLGLLPSCEFFKTTRLAGRLIVIPFRQQRRLYITNSFSLTRCEMEP